MKNYQINPSPAPDKPNCLKLAISGKGGVGKTTLSALLARALRQQNLKVIAVDADPDANLARALGFPQDLEITPLVDLKELIKERVGAEPGKTAVYFQLNPRVDDIPERFSVLYRGGNTHRSCPTSRGSSPRAGRSQQPHQCWRVKH